MLLHPVGWSDGGLLSVAHRYSTPERIDDYLSRRPENEEPPGLRVWNSLDDWNDAPFTIMERLLWRLFISPGCDVVVGLVRDGEWTRQVPLPAPGDCDDAGLCRCGCGLRAWREAP